MVIFGETGCLGCSFVVAGLFRLRLITASAILPSRVFSASSAFDSDQASVDWLNIYFTISEPSGTDIKFQIRTATTQGGLNSATWYGPTSTSDYYTTTGTAVNSVHDGERWIQYKAYFSGPSDDTPTLSDVIISYSGIPLTFVGEVIGGGYCLVSADTSE